MPGSRDRAGSGARKVRLSRQKPVLDREFDVEQVDVFQLQQVEEERSLRLSQDETYFHRQVRRDLKERFLVQRPVPTEAGYGTHRGAALQAELAGKT